MGLQLGSDLPGPRTDYTGGILYGNRPGLLSAGQPSPKILHHSVSICTPIFERIPLHRPPPPPRPLQ